MSIFNHLKQKKSAFAFVSVSFITVVFTLSTLLFLNSRASLPTHDSQGQAIPSLAPMLSKITDAVVNISTSSNSASKRTYQQLDLFDEPFFNRFFKQQQPRYSEPKPRQKNLGSGVIINSQAGYILTNNHVIADADNITIT